MDDVSRTGGDSVPDRGMNILATLRGQWARAWERWLPPVAWMGLIFYLSSQPDLPSAPEPLLELILKKTAHAFVYAVLAALFHRATSRDSGTYRQKPPLGLAGHPPPRSGEGQRWGPLMSLVPWLLAALYAVSDEMHQTFVPGRSGRMTDVLIDAVGAAAGVSVMVWLRRRRPRS